MNWSIIIVNMSVLPKAIRQIQCKSASKFQQQFSQKWIKNPKICMETQGTLNNPSHLEKKSKAGSIMLFPDLKILQSYGNQSSVAIDMKMTHRSREQIENEPRACG